MMAAHPMGGAERCDNAGKTVVIAALRDAVGMTSGHEGRKGPICTRQGHPDVAGEVSLDIKVKLSPDAFQVFKHLGFKRAVALAGYACHIFAHFPNMVEKHFGELGFVEVK